MKPNNIHKCIHFIKLHPTGLKSFNNPEIWQVFTDVKDKNQSINS